MGQLLDIGFLKQLCFTYLDIDLKKFYKETCFGKIDLLVHLISSIKVKNILKGSLDLIQSPSPSVKIQILDGKVCLRCKGKTLLGFVSKLLKTKSLLTSPSNVLPYYLKETFLPTY